MPRTMLTDKAWLKLKLLMEETGRVYNKFEHRNTLEGILYRMRTGIPWRDLPSDFGDWSTVYRRFNLWSKKGILDNIFKVLAYITDSEWLFIDGTIVRAHQHSSGAQSQSDESIGKSRGGLSTKIHLAVDSYGYPVHFELTGGQRNDFIMAEALIRNSPKSDYVVADKGYDSQSIRDFVTEQANSKAVIPRRKDNTKKNKDMDWCLYKYRHLVENAFARIKHFRAISTRYDKLERNYASMVSLAFAIMWLPMHC
ncbi:IS5 family transposase [Catenovulum sediminis]|nr:IS5 family transposase [Catenovulum sediminis]